MIRMCPHQFEDCIKYYSNWRIEGQGSVTYFAVRRETTECRVVAQAV